MASADCEPCAPNASAEQTAPMKELDETIATVSDSEERDDAECTDANVYLQKNGFHEFYMKKDQLEYIVPVIFEDGMDFQECEQYYASLKSQEPLSRSSLRTRLQRKSSLRELQQIIANDSPSCLRRMPKFKSKIDLEKAKVRRCSFGGTAPVENERPCLQRSNSHRSVKESSPGVSFDQHVRVWTVYAAYEYPQEIRSQMWMSREEMRHCMQKAVAEKVAERRRQLLKQQQEQERRRLAEEQKRQEEEQRRAEEEQRQIEEEKKESVQRQPSDNCVMAECIHSSQYIQATEAEYHTSERLEI